MMYVDGFVAAVPVKNKAEFVEHAAIAKEVFESLGALQVVDCWADDVPEGKMTSFPKAVQCNEDEEVVFGWIIWPSREVRDVGMSKVSDDPRMNCRKTPMPFDGQRMIFGGFTPVVGL